MTAVSLVAVGVCFSQTTPASKPSQNTAPAASAGDVPEFTVVAPTAVVAEPAKPETAEPHVVGPAPKQGKTTPAASAKPAATTPEKSSEPAAQPAVKLPKGPGESTAALAKMPSDQSAESQEAKNTASRKYVLGPNDVVAITVWEDAHFTGARSIGPDGTLNMPLIREVQAAGLTLDQLQDVLTQKLSAFIKDPDVSVELARINSKKYTLAGEIGRPGPVMLTQQTTILDALTGGGGFSGFANTKKIYLLRKGKKYFFNYKEVVDGKHPEQNITVEDGDLIYVP